MQAIRKGLILNNSYEIIEEIGTGGGGVVFKAKHLRLNTEVVVKKIKNEVLGKIDSRKEADILKKLKHPYLPRVYDFIELDDAVYTVMDYIPGVNLDKALEKNGKFSQQQVKRWAEQLGEAIAYLHSQTPPIIHSDIKLANIMLTEDNNICLIDFNVSLAMGEDEANSVGISAGFSPPEQYRTPELYVKLIETYYSLSAVQANYEDNSKLERRSKLFINNATEILNEEKTEILENDATEILINERGINSSKNDLLKMDIIKTVTESEYIKYLGKGIDERSDIYSLGVTLYVLLTGQRLPYDFNRQIVREELSKYISEGFLQVLIQMLEIAPEKRFQNGTAFLDAIRNCYKLDKEYITKRRKRLAIQIIFMLLIAILILGGFWGAKKSKQKRKNMYYEMIEQAKESINQKKYSEAEQYIFNARQFQDEKIDSYETELLLLYNQRLYEECIKKGMEYINAPLYIVSTESDSVTKANICYITANSYYEIKDYSNALLLFETAIDIYQENPLYFRDYAICLAKVGNHDAAKIQLENGVKIGMSKDSLYMVNGEVAFLEGELEKATDMFLKCIEETGDDCLKNRAILSCSDVYKRLGNNYIGREKELLETYNSSDSLAILERLADVYGRLAICYPEEAENYYSKALELFINIQAKGYNTYQIRENTAIIYESLGELEKAEEILVELKQDYSNKYEIYKRIAYLEADKQQNKRNEERDYKKMKEYYEQAFSLYDDAIQDMEMEMLKNMMEEIEDGGWF